MLATHAPHAAHTPHKPTPATRKGLHAQSPPAPSRSPAVLERVSADVSVASAASVPLDPSHRDTLLIGRDASTVDVHIDSTRQPNMISRLHAILRYAAEDVADGSTGWRLVDQRSVNGVFVNDVKVAEALLKDGDVLCFGGGASVKEGARRQQLSSEFRFVFRSPQLQPHQPPAREPAASNHSSMPSTECETALTSPTSEWKTVQRSISLPFAAHARSNARDVLQRPVTHAQDTSPLVSPLGKRKRAALDAEDGKDTAEADRLRIERLESERRESQEQYLMAVADMEKRDQDRRQTETRYRDQHRRQQQEIEEERQRVAALERERAEKQASDEAERKRMEESVAKLEAERERMDASEQADKQRIKAELDAMRQRMEEMKEASESERTSAERMKEEFICQCCLSALLAPLTLACSHSFCSPCLYGWFQSQHDTCISCRQPVNLPPIRALSLDNAIAHLLSGDELDDWRQRTKEWTDEQRAEQRRHKALMDHIEQQRRTNPGSLAFMSISTAWTDDEKKLFADGFAPYVKSEECRRAYCTLVGLTEEWVLQRARVDELKRACANLRLKESTEPSSALQLSGTRSELEKAELQRRFWLLLKLGCRVVK